MVRAAALLAALAASAALAQGGLEPAGRLPPTTPSLGPPPQRATPVDLPRSSPARGAVLEQVAGTVREVDRQNHRIVVEAGTERVTLSLDRNTMVYTSAGLGTVLDVVPGAQIRAGRNADMVAYWVQIRPTATISPALAGTTVAPLFPPLATTTVTTASAARSHLDPSGTGSATTGSPLAPSAAPR